MPPPLPSTEFPHVCPRCGYDQRGVIAAWSDSCPLDGRCSECGLEFRWQNILDPRLHLASEFEFAQSGLTRSFFHTLALNALPWRFWKQMSMEYPVVGKRLAMYVCAVWAVAHLLTIATAVLFHVLFARSYSTASWWEWVPHASMPYLRYSYWGPMKPLITAFALGWFGLVPLTFFLLPVTLRTCRVRPRHLFRIAAYAVLGPAMILLATVFIQSFENIPYRFASVTNVREYLYRLPLYRSGWLTPLALAPWLMTFWYFALARYLRLPNPFAVTLVLIFLAALLVTLITFLLAPQRFGLSII